MLPPSVAFSPTVCILPAIAAARTSPHAPSSYSVSAHLTRSLILPNGPTDGTVHFCPHVPQSNLSEACKILSMTAARSTRSIQNWRCADSGHKRGARKASSESAVHSLQDAHGDDVGGLGGSNGGGGGGGDGGDGGDGRGPDGNNYGRRLFGAYCRLLEKRALQTKIVTSAILTLLSDVIAQTFEQGGKLIFDGRRLFALFMVGGVLTAPMFHVLYGVLEKALPIGAGRGNLFAQLAVDQLVAAPLWLVAFFGLVALFEGRFETNRVARQMERDFIPTMKLTWTIFPPVQLASFAMLKPSLRVLALNIVDLGYTTALSYIKHRPHGEDEKKGGLEIADKES